MKAFSRQKGTFRGEKEIVWGKSEMLALKFIELGKKLACCC